MTDHDDGPPLELHSRHGYFGKYPVHFVFTDETDFDRLVALLAQPAPEYSGTPPRFQVTPYPGYQIRRSSVAYR